MKTWPTKYTLSLYEYREHEIEAMRRSASRERRDLIEAAFAIPVLAALFVLAIFI